MEHSVIVAGLGRCGTTLMFDSLLQVLKFGDFIPDLSKIQWKPQHVYKTHDFAPINLNGNFKVIFMFGDPRNIVLSVHKTKEFDIEAHYKHMHADISRKNLYMVEDVLRIEENFHSWYRPQSFPLMTLRYETMYQNLKIIEDFIQYKIAIPPFKERRFNWANDINANNLTRTYSNLLDHINAAGDIRIFRYENFEIQ